MTYSKLPSGTRLTPDEYISEMNKALQCCDEYQTGLQVVNIGSGYDLYMDGQPLPTSVSAPILSKVKKMVG